MKLFLEFLLFLTLSVFYTKAYPMGCYEAALWDPCLKNPSTWCPKGGCLLWPISILKARIDRQSDKAAITFGTDSNFNMERVNTQIDPRGPGCPAGCYPSLPVDPCNEIPKWCPRGCCPLYFRP